MGGQACVLYGAAEFSRDVDMAVLASDANLAQLRHALDDLQAEPVLVPPLSCDVLLHGHACHFRTHLPDVEGLRIDVMSVLHGCDPFERLWQRRRRLTVPGVGRINVLSLPDLVRAKKTQRDKDWPMVRRLVEADFHISARRPSRERIRFWLREGRTPALLVELGRLYPAAARQMARARPAVGFGLRGERAAVEAALRAEEDACRAADRAYWQPLRAELEQWQHARRRQE
jgi:hypothetical protein